MMLRSVLFIISALVFSAWCGPSGSVLDRLDDVSKQRAVELIRRAEENGMSSDFLQRKIAEGLAKGVSGPEIIKAMELRLGHMQKVGGGSNLPMGLFKAESQPGSGQKPKMWSVYDKRDDASPKVPEKTVKHQTAQDGPSHAVLPRSKTDDVSNPNPNASAAPEGHMQPHEHGLPDDKAEKMQLELRKKLEQKQRQQDRKQQKFQEKMEKKADQFEKNLKKVRN